MTKSLPENSLIIGSKIESNRKRKARENNRGGEIFGGGKYTVLCGKAKSKGASRRSLYSGPNTRTLQGLEVGEELSQNNGPASVSPQ